VGMVGEGAGEGKRTRSSSWRRLLDGAVLTTDDDAHPSQISDLGTAHDQRVDVEPAPGEDPRNAR
jgi:hypothetical protein